MLTMMEDTAAPTYNDTLGDATATASINQVTLVGRTGQDPELKHFDSGSVKASFSLAVNRPGSKENRQTDWFNVEAWGRTAEIVGEYLKKGREVAVSGRLATRTWQDNAGNEREWMWIQATDIQLLGSRRDQEGFQSGGNSGGGYNRSYNQADAAPF